MVSVEGGEVFAPRGDDDKDEGQILFCCRLRESGGGLFKW